MDEIDIKKELKINKNRQEIIEALSNLHEHSDLIEAIKDLSNDAKRELIERFKLSPLQAAAIMEIKKPLSKIPVDKILDEKDNLKKIEAELKSKKS